MKDFFDKEIWKSFATAWTLITVTVLAGMEIVNAQLAPPPPPLHYDVNDHSLDEVIRLLKENKKLLISIRDKVVIISSQQRDQTLQKIREDEL